MAWVLVVGSEHETGLREPLVRMTDGVSLVRRSCGQAQDERKEGNIPKYPLNIFLNKGSVLDQNVNLPDYEWMFPIVNNSVHGAINHVLPGVRYHG
jgi:hypothetical protein